MAGIPVKTWDDFEALRSGALPIESYFDPNDSNPVVLIEQAGHTDRAIGLNWSALLDANGLLAAAGLFGGTVSGHLLVDDGTKLVSVAMGGDATLASNGAVTIAAAPATGKVAVGLVDFDSTGDCTKVTVGAVDYVVNVAPTVTNGEWAVGASAANSATNLAAGINGDTRNAGGPTYKAVVGAGTSTVFIFALAAGTAGNVTVAKTGGANPDVTNNLVGGVAVGAKRISLVAHTVTTEEGVQDEINIPLPFTPTTFLVQFRSSAGAIKAVTDVATIGTAPARINIVAAGGTHMAATDVVTILAME